MQDTAQQLFDDLCASFDQIEARFSGDKHMPRQADDENGNDQTGDESGKIAALNDRFRKTHSTEDDEIKGEWIMGDDVNALPPPTKAAIKRKVAEFDDFEDCPLHDHGDFPHVSKDKTYPVIWLIKVFADDSKTALADHPDDPQRSYRVMAVTLSDEHEEDES